MDNNAKLKQKIDKQISGEIPSQTLVNTVIASYNRMLTHCAIENGVWACRKGGARVKARMTKMYIFDRTSMSCVDYAPVVVLYCSSCDSTPLTRGGDSIYSDEIKTLSM